MTREKKAAGHQAQASETAPAPPKKPYIKPALKRLGTVHELTHGTNNATGK